MSKKVKEILSSIDTKDLIAEIESRHLRVTQDLSEDSVDDCSDEELACILEEKGYTVTEDGEYFMLKKFFLGYQLRNHLLEITGQGSYVSDEDLFNELKKLMI